MDAKLQKLIDDLIEQRLSPEESLELNERLRSDAAAAEEFFELLRIHMELSERSAPVRAFSLDELRAIQTVDDQFDLHLADAEVGAAAAKSDAKSANRWKAAFAIAATALIAVSLWAANGKVRQAAQATAFEDGEVARVRRKIDCDWADDRWSIATSASIAEGQRINLNRGLLVLEFASGAEVTLNGPATLVASSGMSAKLIKGELSARVPPQARGFRVETHAGDFVDLGTEFGMLVAEDGEVETHVFNGQVVAEPTHVDGAAPPETLLETGDAWLRPQAGNIETNIHADPGKFLLPLPESKSAIPASPPTKPKPKLWFAADSLVQRDDANGVTEWGDIAASENRHRENAWQVTPEERPKWIAQSIGGKPALRFDGYKGLVTEPCSMSPNQAFAVVFRVDGDVAKELILERPEFRELGVQLLNFNGPPHAVMQVNDTLTLEARVHLGFVRDKAAPVDVGLTKTRRPLDNAPHVLVYSFDTNNSRAQLYLDGELIAESTDVPKLDSTNAPRFIGSHYERKGFGFTGDIAEVLIYDDALDAKDCETLSSWLGNKYQIQSASEKGTERVAERRD
jgi:hypothetical protein